MRIMKMVFLQRSNYLGITYNIVRTYFFALHTHLATTLYHILPVNICCGSFNIVQIGLIFSLRS